MQARILSRVEHPRPSFPPSSRLLLLAIPFLSARRHVHHLPRQLHLPRTRNELHHQEVTRVRVPCHDAPASNHRNSEVQVLPPQDDPKRK